jgi:hypothetical protein
VRLFRYERKAEGLAPRDVFLRRLAGNVGLAFALILVSLLAGMWCYHYFEGLGAVDAFDHAAMILGGMGPYREPVTTGGKIFAGIYALYSGLLVVGVTGLILAPIFHRVMHSLHVPDEDAGTSSRSSKSQASRKRG